MSIQGDDPFPYNRPIVDISDPSVDPDLPTSSTPFVPRPKRPRAVISTLIGSNAFALQTFDEDTHNYDDWMRSFKEFAHIQCWSEQTKIRMFMSYFTYEGANYIESLMKRNPDLTWQEIEQKMAMYYREMDDPYATSMKILGLFYTREKPLANYWLAKRSLIRKLPRAPTLIQELNMYIRGLPDDIRGLVNSRNFTSSDNLFQCVKRIDDLVKCGYSVQMAPKVEQERAEIIHGSAATSNI